jgi:hypothetical protein
VEMEDKNKHLEEDYFNNNPLDESTKEFRDKSQERGCLLIILAIVLGFVYSLWWFLILLIFFKRKDSDEGMD